MRNEISDAYLSRPAEMLVLKGYRHWTMGIVTQEVSYWNDAWNLFATILGSKKASHAMDAMINFVKTLGLCASCPLKTYTPDCAGLCRDECLVLGLISGIQYSDQEAVELCLRALTCQSRCDEVSLAAGMFALALKSSGLMLCPIPATVLNEVIGNKMPSTTIH